MTVQALAFTFGALFILIALIGGGFEAKELHIPRVSTIGRIFSAAIGVVFLYIALGTRDPQQIYYEKLAAAEEARKTASRLTADAEDAAKLSEQKRDAAELARRTAEQEVEAAELARRTAEEKAKAADQARQAAESKAASAEKERLAAEQKAAEEAKKAAGRQAALAEEAKKAAEIETVAAEEAQRNAQQKAVAAEEARNTADQKAVVAEDAEKSSKLTGDALKRFKIKSNRDMYGQDIPSSDGRAGSFALNTDACASKCDILKSCVAFSFDQWNKQCYLKNKIISSNLDPRSLIGVKSEFDLPKPLKQPAEMKILRNNRFRGNLVAHTKVDDFGQCRTSCEKDMRCVAFSFVKASVGEENCEMFNQSEVGYFSQVGADSGWKEQSPNSN